MISDTIKSRLNKARPMTSITLRVPVDVVESMKSIAPYKGFSGYQALLKSYIRAGYAVMKRSLPLAKKPSSLRH